MLEVCRLPFVKSRFSSGFRTSYSFIIKIWRKYLWRPRITWWFHVHCSPSHFDGVFETRLISNVLFLSMFCLNWQWKWPKHFFIPFLECRFARNRFKCIMYSMRLQLCTMFALLLVNRPQNVINILKSQYFTSNSYLN